ncbi:MAG: biotin/lipoate A/B protein ligase family protein [Chloroflexi bacterium]|nr:biotin/lipoate A/B protein ligase family protein [Chloroflexota bacterium]
MIKNPIRLLDLGLVPPIRSQTIYHAVGHALTADSPDTIILVAPERPYVCIGYHQDLEREVDLDYCRSHDLPVSRREVGGGAVYLDAGQLFMQWVFHRDALPHSLEAKFELYIRPLVETYQALGIAAYHRPVNDVHVAGKKIGGTGAAQMGEAEVLVGSLMFTFAKATMARVLKVSSEKMRDKIFESLEQYMTTMAEQVSPLPARAVVRDLYLARAAAALDRGIVPGAPTAAELALAAELDERFISEEWLYQKGNLRRAGVKIHEDVQVAEGAFKAPGGLIRATVRLRAGQVDDLELAGDFTVFPAAAVGALQAAVRDAELARDALAERFAAAYRDHAIQAPGVTPEHLADAVLAAVAVR